MMKTFWLLFAGFLALSVFYFSDYYFLHIFEVEEAFTGKKVHTFQILYGLMGLAFGFYTIHLLGYLEGLREGYERGLENGKKTKSNKT